MPVVGASDGRTFLPRSPPTSPIRGRAPFSAFLRAFAEDLRSQPWSPGTARRAQSAREVRRPKLCSPTVPRVPSALPLSQSAPRRPRVRLEPKLNLTFPLSAPKIAAVSYTDHKESKEMDPNHCRRRLSLSARLRKNILVQRRNQPMGCDLQLDQNARTIFNLRDVARKVRTVVFIRQLMMELSASRTHYSATASQYLTLNASGDPERVTFNKDWFVRGPLTSRLPSWAKDILSKKPSLRTESEGRRLHVLFRDLSCFDKFTDEMQLSICKNLELIEVEPGRVLIRQGQSPQFFYSLYSGSVFNLQREEDGSFDESILRRGHALGELSLLKGVVRDCTVYARERSEVLYMEKHAFLDACAKLFQREHAEKLEFMQKMELFQVKGWTGDKLYKLCLEAQTQYFKPERIVTSSGRHGIKDEWMYICMEGQCKVIQVMSLIRREERQRLLRRPPRLASDRGPFVTSIKPEIYGFGHMHSKPHGNDTEEFSDDESVIGSEEEAAAEEEEKEEEEEEEEDDEEEEFSDDELEAKLREIEASHPELVRSVINKTREVIVAMVREFFRQQKDPNVDVDTHVMTEHIFRYESEKRRRKSRDVFHKALEESKLGNASTGRKPQMALNLTAFLTEHLHGDKHHNFLLVLATVNPGDIFDLPAVLQPKAHRTLTRLLISSGAKILKLRKTAFFRNAFGPLLEEVREFAEEHRYPNLSELRDFFSTKTQWLSYRSHVVDEVIEPLTAQARRRYQGKMMTHLREVSVMQPLN